MEIQEAYLVRNKGNKPGEVLPKNLKSKMMPDHYKTLLSICKKKVSATPIKEAVKRLKHNGTI